MQLFLLGAGTAAGKPAQLLCILVTAADYCFVYNGSTARLQARPGPMVLGAAHWEGYTIKAGCDSMVSALGMGSPLQHWGLLSSPGSSRGGRLSSPNTSARGFACNINHFRARSLVRT